MWLSHWGLDDDPFGPRSNLFVPISGHVEAAARVQHCLLAGIDRSEFRGPSGLGKSVVLNQALEALRAPSRRIVRVVQPVDGSALVRGLAEGLGLGPRAAWNDLDPTSGRALAMIADAIRLAKAQGLSVVIAIDDDRWLDRPEDQRLLDRLAALGDSTRGSVPLVLTGPGPLRWPQLGGLRIVLPRLTRSEAGHYLSQKLQAAGCQRSVFSAPVVSMLHARSEGLPGVLDRLAGLALRASAVEGLAMVTPKVIEGILVESIGT